jgi:hypothetical protein
MLFDLDDLPEVLLKGLTIMRAAGIDPDII